MTLTRQMIFWVLPFVVGVSRLWLLQRILLPFVAGMVLAYLLDPLANRLERMGVSRLVASLRHHRRCSCSRFVILILIFVPILGAQLGAFIEKIPGYVSRCRRSSTDPSRPWLRKIVGDGVADAQESATWSHRAPAGSPTFLQVAVVGRAGADLGLLAGGRDAGGRVLSALRLAAHGRDGRQLDSAAASRHRARARARNGCSDCRLRARADRGLSDPRLVLCGRADARRPEFRPADRARLRASSPSFPMSAR